MGHAANAQPFESVGGRNKSEKLPQSVSVFRYGQNFCEQHLDLLKHLRLFQKFKKKSILLKVFSANSFVF